MKKAIPQKALLMKPNGHAFSFVARSNSQNSNTFRFFSFIFFPTATLASKIQ